MKKPKASAAEIINDGYKLVPVKELQPHPRNPRKHDPVIEQSIEENGFYGAVIVQKSTNYILAGEGRWRGAQVKGLTRVPVIYADVNDEKALRILLADNRTSDLAGYDDGSLASLLQELARTADTFEGTGWQPDDVDDLLRQIQADFKPDVNPDVIPEPPANPKTKPGDLYLLGEHRLLCGDSCNPEDVARLLAGAEPELLCTDPPYGVSLDPRWRDKVYNKLGPGALPYMTHPHGNRTMSSDTRADWSAAFKLVPSLMVAYVWHADRFALEVGRGLEEIGFTIAQQIVWDKQVFAMSRMWYHSGHESCWLARKEGYTLRFLAHRDQSTVWRAASPKQIMSGSHEEKFDHPAQKPVVLFETPIRNHLRLGGLVYDPFLGSGTCLIAAQMTGAHCLGMEIEPRYVDVICARFQALTGTLPLLASSGPGERLGKPVDFSA